MSALDDVAAERRRQIEVAGFDAAHEALRRDNAQLRDRSEYYRMELLRWRAIAMLTIYLTIVTCAGTLAIVAIEHYYKPCPPAQNPK